MKKPPRFREINKTSKTSTAARGGFKLRLAEIYFFDRFYAFVIDLFMIYTPILYIAYFILGSSSKFLHSQLTIFICNFLYAVIYALLLNRTAQTPGCRAYGLKILSNDGKKISFLRALARFYLMLFSFCLIVPAICIFWNKSKKTLYDSLLGLGVFKYI